MSRSLRNGPFGRALAGVGAWLTARTERGPLAGVLVALAFGGALGFVHYHHEFWRDELHPWGLGRNATGFWDIAFGGRRYDGHPLLWYYFLHLASRVIAEPVGLHVVGVGLATLSSYLWFRHSGFPRLLRLLLLPSYFWFYEYGVVTRLYALGITLICLFCTVYRRERPRYLLLSSLLVLLSMTSVYGALCAAALGLFLYTPRPWRWTPGGVFVGVRGDRRHYLFGMLLLLAGAYFAARTSLPPADAFYARGWKTDLTLQTLSSVCNRYWLALMTTSDDWWSATALGSASPGFARWVPWCAGLLFILLLASFWRAPMLAATYALGVGVMALFGEMKYGVGMRHIGHFFLLLVACGWLLNREVARPRRLVLHFSLMFCVLVVQSSGGIKSALADIERPFSSAGEAADFLRGRLSDDAVVIGSVDAVAAGVAQHLDRAFLFADTGDYVKTVVSHDRRFGVDSNRLFSLAASPLAAKHPVWFVLNFPLYPRQAPGMLATLVHTTKSGIVIDERFYLYRVDQVADPQ